MASEAQRQKRQYEAIFASTPDLVYVFDLDYRFTFANEALLEMWGRTVQDSIGKTLLDVGYEPWHAEMHEREIDEVIATKRAVRGEVAFPHAKLGHRTYDYIFVPVLNSAGEVESVAGTTRDITDRKRMEDSLYESEQRARLAIDTAKLGTWHYEFESDTVHLDERMRTIWGVAVDEATIPFARVIDRIHPDDREEVVRAVTTALEPQTHGTYGVDYRIVLDDSSVRWVAANGQVRFEGKGTQKRVAGFLGTALDITERMHAEDVLRASERRQAFIVQFNDRLRFLHDPQEIMRTSAELLGVHLGVGRAGYGEVDAAGERLSIGSDWTTNGMPSFAGDHYLDAFGPNLIAEYRAGRTVRLDDALSDQRAAGRGPAAQEVAEAFAKIDTRSGIGVPLTKKGRWVAVLFVHQSEPRVWTDDEVALVEEIALRTWATVERARSESELQRLNADLERRVRERTAQLQRANSDAEAFAYSVAHDLRAPLRSIDGFSQVLTEEFADDLDVTARDYLERVRDAAKRMGSIIDDLLNLSRIGKEQIENERVDLSNLSKRVLDGLRAQDPDRKVRVTIQDGVEVCGDPGLFGIVQENLLGNAWKFTRERDDAHIEFGVRDEANGKTYFVRDNGIGFDRRYAESLFVPFKRLHKADVYSGSGVGLATVQRIIHRHDGTIWAESEPGKGATFFFRLDGQ